MTELDRILDDLVIANRILAFEEVLDAYGHVSVRHPRNPDRYFLSRSLSPELVTRADVIEFHLDGTPVNREEDRPFYLERFIHGGVYEKRPDVNAVVHSHAEDVLAFSVTGTPLRPVFHAASDIGSNVPVWDIAEKFGDETTLQVTNVPQSRDLAERLGQEQLVLMVAHGFAAAAPSLFKVVRMSVYVPQNARIMARSLSFGGPIRTVSEGEIRTRMKFDPASPAMQRAWEYWAQRAGCGHLLGGTAREEGSGHSCPQC
jgi:ribulose-5-phosphate 4-epimerase/fuculose-1-phosphate aldolase